MTSLKIQCACGQKFVFDVEPVNGRMPAPVKCPGCGADATQAANDQLAQSSPSAPPPPPVAPAPKKRRLPLVLGLCAGGLLLLAASVGAAYWFLQPNQPPPPPVVPSSVVCGVGLAVERDYSTRRFVVAGIFPTSPAAKANVPTGVFLYKIDGILAETKTINQIAGLLRGPEGTKVSLELIDPKTGATNEMELTRAVFDRNAQ